MRSVESCRYREAPPSTNQSQGAVCGLVRELTGLLDPELCAVSLDACLACCGSFAPSAERINPVIASLVHRGATDVIAVGGKPGCSLEQALALRSFATEHLQMEFPANALVSRPARSHAPCCYLGPEISAHAAPVRAQARAFACAHPGHSVTTEDLCHRCRDWASQPRPAPPPLTELIPSERVRQGSRVKKWAVGVTSSPRRVPTVDWSVDSVIRAGWGAPRVFQDGAVKLAARLAGLDTTVRTRSLGAWPNFFLGLAELLMQEPDADAYLMVQDDALFYDRQDVRRYLEQVLWFSEPPGLVSLYCSSAYTRPGSGWYQIDPPWVWGALAFVFPRELALRFVSDAGVINHRRTQVRDGCAQIDVLIGVWAERHGIPIDFPTPSLVQHIGDASTIWRTGQAFGPRRADRFLGDLD